MLNTPHRNCVSLKKTMDDARSSPKPRLNTTKQKRKYTASRDAGEKFTPVNMHTRIRGMREMERFTRDEMTRVKG